MAIQRSDSLALQTRSEGGMTTVEACERIEDARFGAIVNLASNLKTFLRIVSDQPEIRTLFAQGKAGEIRDRLLLLAAIPGETGYEHPADASIAAYLWLLSQKAPDLARTAAETVLQRGPFWWARKVAELVQGQAPFKDLPRTLGNGTQTEKTLSLSADSSEQSAGAQSSEPE